MYIKGTGTLATKAQCVFKEYANKKSCKEPSDGLAFPGDSLLLFRKNVLIYFLMDGWMDKNLKLRQASVANIKAYTNTYKLSQKGCHYGSL